MWVLDASAAAELLLGTDRGLDVEAALGADDIYAPQLLAVEVLSVLRGMVRGGHLAVRRAEAALDDLEDLGRPCSERPGRGVTTSPPTTPCTSLWPPHWTAEC